MMAADAVAVVQAQPVHGVAGHADVGVEVDFAAPEAVGFGVDPLQQLGGVTLVACLGQGADIVNVDVAAPSQIVGEAETANGHGLFFAFDKNAHQAVAVWALDVVDLADKMGG